VYTDRVGMLGASARVLPLGLLAREFGLSHDEAVEVCRKLGVIIDQTTFPVATVDLFAVEAAWHRIHNPDLFRGTPDQAVTAIAAIGRMYEGAHREAILARIDEEAQAAFPEYRRRVRQRQAARRYYRRKQLARGRRRTATTQ